MPEYKPDNPSRKNDPNAAKSPAEAPEGRGLGQAELAEMIRRLGLAGGIPITLSLTPPPAIDTGDLLSRRPRETVAFPPCADELLALIRTNEGDEITSFFREYFKFRRHHILGELDLAGTPPVRHDLALDVPTQIDPDLLACPDGGIILLSGGAAASEGIGAWPSDCCLCGACVTLDGNRNRLQTPGLTGVEPSIRRLFIGDLVWLFYFEQLGIFQILGAILDSYAGSGRLPISNDSLQPPQRGHFVGLVLEVMTRAMRTGMSSSTRDRASAFRTCLGWNSTTGRKLRLDTEVNTGFTTLFHRFIYNALEFYKDKRLAVAIRGTAAPVAPPSVATLITISDTIDVLKKRFEPFSYGRNYYNTLAGIVWAVAGMSVIRELRTTLGIPPAFGDPHEFIPAAYDLLVLKRPITQGETNRFLIHRECARNGRDVLLDLEVVNHLDRNPGGALENWLTQVESKIEGYRTAYRALTGIDLGASGAVQVEQQV